MEEEVVFWKWISSSYIGIVTLKCVYHWHIEGTGGPKKIFDRHSSLENCQIINYKCNAALSWCFLIGIYSRDHGVGGTIQLFSESKSASQIIDGHAAAFADLLMKSDYATYTVNLFCFASRASASLSKLHIVEIDHNDAYPTFQKVSSDIFFPTDTPDDFPVALQIGHRFDIIYMITKLGFIHLYDLQSGACIFMNRVSMDTIFVTTEYIQEDGIIGVNRSGQVLKSFTIYRFCLFPFLKKILFITFLKRSKILNSLSSLL